MINIESNYRIVIFTFVLFYSCTIYSQNITDLIQKADSGDNSAQLELGQYYEGNDEYGDKIRAYKWYAKSASKGNLEAVNWIAIKKKERYLRQYLKEEDYENIDFYADLIDLSEELCFHVNSSGFNKTLDKTIENEILLFLNVTKEDDNYKTKLMEFWNRYNKFFICFDDDSTVAEHILKRSLNELFYKHNQILFNWLFELDKTVKVDFNQIIYYDSKPETILDFLDEIVQNKYEFQYLDISEIIVLRNTLYNNYNAKTASELKN